MTTDWRRQKDIIATRKSPHAHTKSTATASTRHGRSEICSQTSSLYNRLQCSTVLKIKRSLIGVSVCLRSISIATMTLDLKRSQIFPGFGMIHHLRFNKALTLLMLVLLLPTPCDSFTLVPGASRIGDFVGGYQAALDSRPQNVLSPTTLFESTSGERPTPAREETNLVDQKRFVNSIETLKQEVAKANGQPYASPEKPPVHVLGRFEVPLRIDTAPGLDLTETAPPEGDSTDGGLVLVTSVSGNAADAGLQPLDTIVSVSCPDVKPPFYANVNSESLQTTAIALQTAVAHALSHNSTEIQLEMNRLMQGYYN